MSTPVSQEPAAPQPPEDKKKQKPIVMIILIGLVVVLVVVIGAMLLDLFSGGEEAAPTATLPATALPPAANPTIPPPTIVPPPPESNVPTGTSTDYLNIRSGPSTEYPIYGVANPGATSEIVGKSADNAWWAVKIPTSLSPDGIGWASADYVTVTGDTANLPVIQAPPPPQDINPPPPPSDAFVVQTTEPVNVRAGPSNDYPSYGKVPAGTPLEAQGISQDGKWVAVTIPTSFTPSGIGWVNAAYLQPFDSSSLPTMQP